MKSYFVLFFILCALVILSFASDDPVNRDIKGRTFTGVNVQQIEFPIGGIGTGNIILGGRGDIKHIEFFNKANRSELPPELTFFAARAKVEGERPVSRILERQLLPPFSNGFGIPRQQLAGMPRFSEVSFTGGYPFADLVFKDKFPVNIELRAFNPFIPLSPDKSGIPCAIFNWKVYKPGTENVDVSIVFNMANPVKIKSDRGRDIFRRNINEYIGGEKFSGIKMTSGAVHKDSLDFAEIAMLTTDPAVDIQTRWYRGNWWDNAHIFWEDFSKDGRLTPVTDALEADDGKTDVASLLVFCRLKPGESRTIPFYLCWYVPNRTTNRNYALGQEKSLGKILKNYYAVQFSDVLDVSGYLVDNIDQLYAETKKYHNILFNSTFPEYVLDAVSSNTAALKTNLLMRVEDGDLHGFEGLGNDFGCCAGTCTHVWNYEQSMASLFPTLEQNVRKTAYTHDTFDNGFQAHRSVFPLGEYWFDGPPAADGQMGNIIRVYREWKNCGDSKCLRLIWPKVKASLEFAWKGVGDVSRELKWQKNSMQRPWDPDKDGIIEGRQHNTYDIDFFGPNTMIGSLYLAALKAASEMAVALGEPDKADEYMAVYNSGVEKLNGELWNGEYYIQKIEVMDGLTVPERLKSPPDENGKIIPKYQYGDGCLSDQLLGQYLAFVSGLGYILDSTRVKKAMASVYKYNYIDNLSEFENVQRVYGINDEGGLMTCTWPGGNRPALPFVYSDELWTGIEYQAAATMIFAGLVDEGLQVVETVRNRYGGWNRNPFSEIESGFYYARSMSSWSVLLALSGFQYDGVQNTIGFAPRINTDHFSTFWSNGNGWGSFTVKDNTATFKVEYGRLDLNQFGIGNLKYKSVRKVILNSDPVQYDTGLTNDRINLQFSKKITMNAGDALTFILK